MAETKGSGLFYKIKTKDDAIAVINQATIAFYVLAILFFLELILIPSLFVVAIFMVPIYGGGGYLIRRKHSFPAAVAILIINLFSLIATFPITNRLYLIGFILYLSLLFFSVRAVEATKKIKRFKVESDDEVEELST